MTDLLVVWAELMDELTARAPRTREGIRPPVPGAADAIERALELELPADIRDWFGLHNGGGWDFSFGQLLGEEFLLSAADAISVTTRLRAIMSDFPGTRRSHGITPGVAGTVANTWLAEYVAIGDDTGGSNLYVDLRTRTIERLRTVLHG
jgi:cell wall assembly regulator SMI1